MASGKDTSYLFMTVTDSSITLMPYRACRRIDDTVLTIACHCSDAPPYIPHQHTIYVAPSPIDCFGNFAKYRQQLALRNTFYGKSRVFEVRCFLETFPLQVCGRFFRNAYNVGDSSPLGVLILSNTRGQLIPILKTEEVRETHVPSQTWGMISSASGQSGSSGFLSMLFKPFIVPAAVMCLSFDVS